VARSVSARVALFAHSAVKTPSSGYIVSTAREAPPSWRPLPTISPSLEIATRPPRIMPSFTHHYSSSGCEWMDLKILRGSGALRGGLHSIPINSSIWEQTEIQDSKYLSLNYALRSDGLRVERHRTCSAPRTNWAVTQGRLARSARAIRGLNDGLRSFQPLARGRCLGSVDGYRH